jgi:hypothetical protein
MGNSMAMSPGRMGVRNIVESPVSIARFPLKNARPSTLALIREAVLWAARINRFRSD